MSDKKFKYKTGLVLGKMYPPTKGHLYLIDTALEYAEKVHIIVCHNSTQDISGKDRTWVLKQIYHITRGLKDRVKIHSFCDDGLPQNESYCKTLDEFYSYWVPVVYDNVPELDVVFTSEAYGDDFGRYLGVDHFLVDKARKRVNISATRVRENPFKEWVYIPKKARYLFTKRVAIMGPESVGKSLLTEKLAEHFKTSMIHEWGRTVFERNGNKVSLDDFIKISQLRQEDENRAIEESNKLIITDTEDITTYIFSKMYYPDTYKTIEPYFLEKIKKEKPYDLYILLKPDVPGFQDGTRQFLEERWSHYEEIKLKLKALNVNFIEVGGGWAERFLWSKQEIEKLF